MADIINSGVSHPLRVIHLFESIVRHSSVNRREDGVFEYEIDEKRIAKQSMQDLNESISEGLGIEITNLLPNGISVSKVRAHIDHYYRASTYSVCNKIAFLADYIRDKEYDAIIELGSGYSGNLIKLYYQGGPKIPYFGGDYTESGTETAMMLSTLTDEFELTPFRFDFCQPDFSMFQKFKKILFFTCHAIEQVHQIPEDLFLKMSSVTDQVTAIHMEPFGFQIQTNNSESKINQRQRDFFLQNKWNINFAETLIKSCKDNQVRLIYLNKNILDGEDPANPTSLAIWES